MLPRLFSAFQLPEAVEDWLSGLEIEMHGARWANPDNFHVTIRFFGDVDGHVADDIVAGLESSYPPAFEARIKGLSCFGGDRPRALVAEIEAGPELAALYRAHERIAQSAGLPPERRKYAPHVTLARLDGARPDTIARFIQSVSEPTLPAFVVNEIVLLSARPGAGGGPYVPEATFNLARGTAGILKSTVA